MKCLEISDNKIDDRIEIDAGILTLSTQTVSIYRLG